MPQDIEVFSAVFSCRRNVWEIYHNLAKGESRFLMMNGTLNPHELREMEQN